MHSRRIKNNWHIIKGQPLTELDKKCFTIRIKATWCRHAKLIKTAEQIEGIRRSSVVNTGVLVWLQERSRPVGLCEIDKLVYDYTFRTGLFGASEL